MIRRRISALAVLAVGLWAFGGSVWVAADPARSSVISLSDANARLFVHPSSPFAVMLFPEDALANHIGVIYYRNMGNPKDGAWTLDDRFWQDGAWGSDATSLAWAADGRVLYVATNPVYGTGEVFRLELMARRAEVVFAPARDAQDLVRSGDDYSLKIVGVDERRRRVKVELHTDNGDRPVELPLR